MKFNYSMPQDKYNDMFNAITMYMMEQEDDWIDRSFEINLIKAYMSSYDSDWD